MSAAPRPPRVFVVLPAYNEESGLRLLLPVWLKVLNDQGLRYHFVIVDDGSTDGTARLLTEFAESPGAPGFHPGGLSIKGGPGAPRFYPGGLSINGGPGAPGFYPGGLSVSEGATVISHRPNQGLGATIRDGLNEAVRQASDADVIVTMDADNTHPPELFPSMLAKLTGEDLDLVIASRYRSGARVVGLSLHRRLLSDGARWLFQVGFPIRGVRDYTCGYRAYRAGFLRHAMNIFGDRFCDQSGFACMVDILLKLARCGARCGEVGMVLRYDQKAGPSAMRVSQTIRRTLKLLLHHRFAKRYERNGAIPADHKN